MIIVMKKGEPEKSIEHVLRKIEEQGLKPVPLHGTERTVIAVIGDERVLHIDALRALTGVENVMAVLKPYKLVSRDCKKEDTVIDINGVKIGGKKIAIMAGPCSVESEDQIMTVARAIKRTGAQFLRGGAFKPRTGPYDFQGLKEEGLKLLAKAREETGLLIVTEVMQPKYVKMVAKYADIIQVGARNMQNFDLLKDLGRINKPVLLKRGMCATYKEMLLAAEYIVAGGNQQVILCERGIRTFVTETRNTLDLNMVPYMKSASHLPVMADPSHGTGKRELVAPMAKASIAAGADGLIIEVHPNPEKAMTDADQTISTEDFAKLMKELKPLAETMGRTL